jgi:hypothetical protein
MLAATKPSTSLAGKPPPNVLTAFHARLEARNPARGRFRFYRIEVGTDLLGDWLVDVTYGRIGSPLDT